jgi:hypothetical protein
VTWVTVRQLHEWHAHAAPFVRGKSFRLYLSHLSKAATLSKTEQTRNSNGPNIHDDVLGGDRLEACVWDTLGWAGWSPLTALAKTAAEPPANQLALGGRMIPASKSPKMRLEELRTTRKPLWERFESHPNEIQLAAELRIIDDLIAECNEKWDRRADHMAQSRQGCQPRAFQAGAD